MIAFHSWQEVKIGGVGSQPLSKRVPRISRPQWLKSNGYKKEKKKKKKKEQLKIKYKTTIEDHNINGIY